MHGIRKKIRNYSPLSKIDKGFPMSQRHRLEPDGNNPISVYSIGSYLIGYILSISMFPLTNTA